MKARAVWFKAEYVAPILSGEKRDTIRQWKRLPAVGDVLACSVGPRPPFAFVQVDAVELARDVPQKRREELFRIYGPILPADLVRIAFTVIDRRAA